MRLRWLGWVGRRGGHWTWQCQTGRARQITRGIGQRKTVRGLLLWLLWLLRLHPLERAVRRGHHRAKGRPARRGPVKLHLRLQPWSLPLSLRLLWLRLLQAHVEAHAHRHRKVRHAHSPRGEAAGALVLLLWLDWRLLDLRLRLWLLS